MIAKVLHQLADAVRRLANRVEPLPAPKRAHYAAIETAKSAPAAAAPWCCPKCGCGLLQVGQVFRCDGLHDAASIQDYIKHWNMTHWRQNPPEHVEACGWSEPAADYGKTWICPPR